MKKIKLILASKLNSLDYNLQGIFFSSFLEQLTLDIRKLKKNLFPKVSKVSLDISKPVIQKYLQNPPLVFSVLKIILELYFPLKHTLRFDF